MNNEYVQQYAKLEREHWWFLVRQKIILQFLKKHISTPDPQLSVLNIGAAAGASSELLKAFGNVVSVEIDPLFIEYLKRHDVEVTEASITQLPFCDNHFDVVCVFDVLEHIADDATAMKEIERVCKHDGSVCIAVPANPFLWSQHDVVNGHCRRYTKKGLLALFRTSSQLIPVETAYFNSLLFLPILVTRKISTFFRKHNNEEESDFSYYKTSAFSNSILNKIFGIELPLMKFMHFPFGVSLISFLKKKSN